ncbi:hypothetical protein T484DRAFT_1761020 [Baffinella frigidus]|nr:hypothetical protein T484DRAFT_1761020 [Cryptophyta sp. CCMP2293]
MARNLTALLSAACLVAPLAMGSSPSMRQPAGGARGLSGLAQDPAAGGGGDRVQECAWCKRTTVGDNVPLQRCGWCRMFFYCSVSCQRAHWPAHRERCPPRSEVAMNCDADDLLQLKSSHAASLRPDMEQRTKNRIEAGKGMIGGELPKGWKVCSSCRLPLMAAWHDCPSCTRPISESDDDLDPVNFMELKSEGEKSGHHPSNDPLEDLLVASENGDRKGVDQAAKLAG